MRHLQNSGLVRQLLSTQLGLEAPPQLPTSYSFSSLHTSRLPYTLPNPSCIHPYLSGFTQKSEAGAGAKEKKKKKQKRGGVELRQRIFKHALPPCGLPRFPSQPHGICLLHCSPPAALSEHRSKSPFLSPLFFLPHSHVHALSAWHRSHLVAFPHYSLKTQQRPQNARMLCATPQQSWAAHGHVKLCLSAITTPVVNTELQIIFLIKNDSSYHVGGLLK